MNVLENWLENLLNEEIDVLNDLYSDENAFREALEKLPLPETNSHPVESSYISDYVLERLHTKVRQEPCELSVWASLVWFLAHPLPINVAHDLIERGIATGPMSHSRQVEEIQWRLATIHEDALYTLITERYELSEYSLDQFQVMLQMYGWRKDDVLYILSYRFASSLEKEAIYLEAVKDFIEVQREKRSLLSNILYAIDRKFPGLQLNMGFRCSTEVLNRLGDLEKGRADG